MTMKKSLKKDLLDIYGNIDIYLFDQLLKGRFDGCRSVLDAGCGKGRNLVFFLRNGFDVFGIDNDTKAIETVRKNAAKLAPLVPMEHFSQMELQQLSFQDNSFDAVICNAVLHFARDESHFRTMLDQLWRVLKPEGLLFIRLASSIGIEKHIKIIRGKRFLLPDESERFLVDEEMIMNETKRLGAELLDPIKTTYVQNLRCMTTWCLRRVTG